MATGTLVGVLGDVTNSGAAFTPTAAASTMYMPNSGREKLFDFDSTAASAVVAVLSVADEAGRTSTLTMIHVTIGGFQHLGPFPPRNWSQLDGTCSVTVGATLTNTVLWAARLSS